MLKEALRIHLKVMYKDEGGSISGTGCCGSGFCILKTGFSAAVSVLPFAVWVSSPFIAYWISKETVYKTETLSDEENLELRRIARKTWRYYEEFVNRRNNYLAPDNFQEDPPNGIAYRTSPTNIGLGMLAALTARDLVYRNFGAL